MKKRLSPCQIHVAMHLAKTAIGAALAGIVAAERPADADTSPYALLRAQLGEHLRELENTGSTELKIQKKQEWLPLYDDHVDTVILTSEETGKALQDDVVVWVAVWTFDVATIEPDLYPRAFELADYVIKYGLNLPPEKFKRSPAASFAEFVADDVLKKLPVAPPELGRPFNLDIVTRALGLVEGRADVVDIVPAKLHMSAARLYVRLATAIDAGAEQGPAGGAQAARTEALKHFRRAYELDNKIGVKQEMDRLAKLLSQPAA